MQKIVFILLIFVTFSLSKPVPRVCDSTGTKCGQCLTDADCPSATPHCDSNNMLCHECVTDAQCRSDLDCNRSCVNFKCDTSSYPVVTCDTATEICYRRIGKCFTKCTTDSFCATIPIVLHYPNTGVCNTTTGQCFDCQTTADCKPYSDISCGAQCIYSPEGYEYLCTNSNTCKGGKSCKLDISGSNNYKCSYSHIITYSSILLVLLLIFSLLN